MNRSLIAGLLVFLTASSHALAQSCNVYFFHHATNLGSARLLDWAGRFGFGQPSGFELSKNDAGQLLPLDIAHCLQRPTLSLPDGDQ